ncbi:MAG: hypothetical protein OXH86_20305 [Acidimicrobiaceae bacterium]|nr:hypothetical protein [Acidimicrobiaceae bacterium]MDE0499689.1 hypothetical protein [Acidimicrobiaceae bacterium]
MSTPVGTTAAMTTPGETAAAAPAEPTVPEPQRSVPLADVKRREPLGARRLAREAVSPNVVISVLGGLIAALMAGMIGLLVWQFGSLASSIEHLGARIDEQGARIDARIDEQGAQLRAEIDSQGTQLRAEIGALRAEMQAGFRSVNETLLDHTDHLARLEAATVIPQE